MFRGGMVTGVFDPHHPCRLMEQYGFCIPGNPFDRVPFPSPEDLGAGRIGRDKASDWSTMCQNSIHICMRLLLHCLGPHCRIKQRRLFAFSAIEARDGAAFDHGTRLHCVVIRLLHHPDVSQSVSHYTHPNQG